MRARVDVSLVAAEQKALWAHDTVAQSLDCASGETTTWSRLLDWYLEGWA